MKQRPIILPPATVQGILAGTITQHIILISEKNERMLGYMLYVRERFYSYTGSQPSANPSCLYFADGEIDQSDLRLWSAWVSKPASQMPKSLARIWLEVTGVRMKRFSDITEADAVAAGFPGGGTWETAPTIQFTNDWDSRYCHAPSESNPWVCIITFKKITITAAPAAQTTTA